MDEPLTVIDLDLKFRLRRKLKEIKQKYRSTLIYVTHDQNEAMTFAENIIIKVKVKREQELPAENVFLTIPAQHCCVYENEPLI